MKVLIHFGMGLGDCCQLSIVLQHLQKYHPDWQIDLATWPGREAIGYGYCQKVWKFHEHIDFSRYNETLDLFWLPADQPYHDSPSTQAVACLRTVFRIDPDPALLKYRIHTSPELINEEANWLIQHGCRWLGNGRTNAVAIHYEGTSQRSEKDLTWQEIEPLAQVLSQRGYQPIILDWNSTAKTSAKHPVACPEGIERITALISQCSLMVGIDSGPEHCAGATDTPTLIVWTGHHPLDHYDLCDNVMHLVPANHHCIGSAQDSGALRYFQQHYRWRIYRDLPKDLAEAAIDLLDHRQTSKPPTLVKRNLRIALPPGIGDSLWCLHKVPALLAEADCHKAHLFVSAAEPRRSKEFLERFDFVSKVEYRPFGVCQPQHVNDDGTYCYHESQPNWQRQCDWFLQANGHLEHGRRLENWMIEYPITWDLASHFHFTSTETRWVRDLPKPYAVLYFGPEAGNSTSGHNRGELWRPDDWFRLANLLRQHGLNLYVTGAPYDRSYYVKRIKHGLGKHIDGIGATDIATTFAICQQAACVISYQCGLGIFSVHLGVPVAMWWRPHGNSLDNNRFISFANDMRTAWVPPTVLKNGSYLGMLYGHETPEDIMAWLDCWQFPTGRIPRRPLTPSNTPRILSA